MIFGLLMSLICGTLASVKKKWQPFASGYFEYKKVTLYTKDIFEKINIIIQKFNIKNIKAY